MKILYLTDTHGTMQTPEGRTDQFYLTFLKKMLEISHAVKFFGADMVIHGGDLFHIPRPSDKFTGMVAEILNGFQVPIYVVPGNHDIDGYTINTIDQTKLGLLGKTGVINLLTRGNPISITDSNGIVVAISGQEYYSGIDEKNPEDYKMRNDDSTNADINILVAHSYVTPDSQHPNIKHTLISDIVTDADIVLCGHYHHDFEVDRDDGVLFVNPGSALRMAQTEYNKTHSPMYGILDITLDGANVVYDWQNYKFGIAQDSLMVFDYLKHTAKKTQAINLSGFKTSLSATTATPKTIVVADIVHQVCNEPDVLKQYGNIEQEVMDNLTVIIANSPNEFGHTKAGYVKSQTPKMIHKIEICNFESHANTVIDLGVGLNIFTGISNSGKSSIFRAIMWATDNDPSGNDFMTTNGLTETWVKLTYSTGEYITRKRTLTDTGTLSVGYFDAGVFKEETYKGFANNIPVTVDNIHQMPIVDITPNISTHLNVISQFDAPFLISESPASKAAAIGRITGTHIIDGAISANKKTVTANQKVINTLNKQVKESKALSDAIDVDKMQLICDEYEAGVLRLTATQAKYDSVLKTQLDITAKSNQVAALIVKIREVTKFNSNEFIIKFIDDKIERTANINGFVSKRERLLDIEQHQKNILFVVKDKIDNYDKININKKLSDYQKALMVQQQCEKYNTTRIKKQLKTLIAAVESWEDKVNTISSKLLKLESMVKTNLSVTVNTDFVAFTNDKITKATEDIALNEKKIQEVNEQLFSDGRCPLCNSEIHV